MGVEVVLGRFDKLLVGKTEVGDTGPSVGLVLSVWIVVPGVINGSLNGFLEIFEVLVDEVEVGKGMSVLSSMGTMVNGTLACFIALHSSAR